MDKVRTPAKVTGAVLGAAALGYLALMNQRRIRAKRPPTVKEAARKLAARLPGRSVPAPLAKQRQIASKPAAAIRSVRRQACGLFACNSHFC